MKKYYFVIVLFACYAGFAQKKVIDTAVFGKWASLDRTLISDDGNYIFYSISNKPIGHQTVIVRSTRTAWEKEFEDILFVGFSGSSHRFIFQRGDSLCLLTLGTGDIKVIPHVTNLGLHNAGSNEYLAYTDTAFQKQITLLQLADEIENRFAGHAMAFSPDGNVLLMQTDSKDKSGNKHLLEWIDLRGRSRKLILKSEGTPSNFTFSPDEAELAFMLRMNPGGNEDENQLYLYKSGTDEVQELVADKGNGIPDGYKLSSKRMLFDINASRLIFELEKKPLQGEKPFQEENPDAVHVSVWNYKDPKMQSAQLSDFHRIENYGTSVITAVNLNDGQLIPLQQEGEEVWGAGGYEYKNRDNDFRIVAERKGHRGEIWWNHDAQPIVCLVSALDGSRKLLSKQSINNSIGDFSFPFSPSGKWFVFYDRGKKAYFSYNLEKGMKLNISKNIPVDLTALYGNGGSYTEMTPGLRKLPRTPIGIGEWLEEEAAIIIYDEYDIWKVDLNGIKQPINLTNGYGRLHKIQFRQMDGGDIPDRVQGTILNGAMILIAFDTRNKYSGFYAESLSGKLNPKKLSMGSWSFDYGLTQKAKDANVWIVRRMSASDAPNCFLTRDFINFEQISQVRPQEEYNWLTSELVKWKTFDGSLSEGILYKPENFDPAKKYPIIFNYYEKKSDELCQFYYPDVSGSLCGINIPYFVSRGYMIFVPDIHYKMGYPGESVVNCVASAAKYLAKLPYADANRMAISGLSYGGFETNYLVTHSHLFAAAAEMAGPTDEITSYGGLRSGSMKGEGFAAQDCAEIGQDRIGATLWDRPDLFIKNSPVFAVNQITTPLLMIHGLNDRNVPFEQALELYTGLRRLRKKAWLLQYDNDGHGITRKEDAMDVTIRLTQFFDYYLKGAPPPVWMTLGVPARLKGIETGLDLDTSGRIP